MHTVQVVCCKTIISLAWHKGCLLDCVGRRPCRIPMKTACAELLRCCARSRPCNLQPCDFNYTVGPWTNCSTYCGPGYRYRSVRCVDSFGRDVGLVCGPWNPSVSFFRCLQQRALGSHAATSPAGASWLVLVSTTSHLSLHPVCCPDPVRWTGECTPNVEEVRDAAMRRAAVLSPPVWGVHRDVQPHLGATGPHSAPSHLPQ